MRLNKYLLPIFTFVALFGAVLTAKATGDWSVSGKQTLDVQNLSSTDDIRGWMTLEQISSGFDIPQPRLYQLLEIPSETTPETALKDLEGLLPEFEITAVRTRVAEFIEDRANHTPSGEDWPEEPGSEPTPVPADQRLPGSEIKGRHTLAEISNQCQVALPDLLETLELPADTDPNLAAKDLVEQGSISEIQSLRDVVSGLQSP